MTPLAAAAAALNYQPASLRRMAKAGRIPGAVQVPDPARGRLAWMIPADWAADPANRNPYPGRGGYRGGGATGRTRGGFPKGGKRDGGRGKLVKAEAGEPAS